MTTTYEGEKNKKYIEKLRNVQELNQHPTVARMGENQHRNLINWQSTYTDKTYE